MTIQSNRAKRGLTLIELMVTTLAALVLIVGVSAMLYHGHVGYNRLFRRVNSEVVRNAYEARRTFDRIVRKSTLRRCDPRDADYKFLSEQNELYVYYFSDPQTLISEDPDKYARFYLNGTELWLEQGNVTGNFQTPPPALPGPQPIGSPLLIARDVIPPASGIFSVQDNAVRMVLILDNETNPPPGITKIETVKMTVTSEAIRHNQ